MALPRYAEFRIFARKNIRYDDSKLNNNILCIKVKKISIFLHSMHGSNAGCW